MNAVKQVCRVTILASSLALVACGGGSSNNNSNVAPVAQNQTISGVAATGNPFVGKVEVINAAGVKSAPVTVAADGTFSVTMAKGEPYLIKATSTGEGQPQTLYSYASKIVAGVPVNVTQLTTAALFDANAKMDLAGLYAEWAKQAVRPTEAEVLQSAKEVIANLKTKMLAKGLTEAEVNGLNVFNYKFTPVASNKFDNLLDDVQIAYTCSVQACTANYTVGDQSFNWNYSIDTNGININFDGSGGGIPTGNYKLKITTTVNGFSTPAVTINNIPKPDSQADFCASSDVIGQFPQGGAYTINNCSFNGTVGNMNVSINTQGLSLNYTIKYEYIAA